MHHPEQEPGGIPPSDGGAPSRGQQPTDEPGSPQRPATNVAPDQMVRFVTSIKNPAQQIGEHVIAALQHADTVAVLTTVVVGPGGQQHIISAALDPQKVAQINVLLQEAAHQRVEEEACVGFHCLVQPRGQVEGGR